MITPLYLALALLLTQRSGVLAGQISDLDGRPLPGVTVRVLDSVRQTAVKAVSGANGEYAFRTLPAGSYRVSYEMVGFDTREAIVEIDTAASVVQDIALAVAMPPEDLFICTCNPLIDSSHVRGRGSPEVGRVREQQVRIVDPTGQPVPGASVHILGQTLTTGLDGVVCYWKADGENPQITVVAPPFRPVTGDTCCLGAKGQIGVRFEVTSRGW